MSVVSSVGCTVESVASRRRRATVADSWVGFLVTLGMAAPRAAAVLEAVRQLRRPGRPVHARVERHAELALVQQRVILVGADVAVEAACLADVVGGGFVILDQKDKGALDASDMTWHALLAICSADGLVGLRVVKGSVLQKACKAAMLAAQQAGSDANYSRDVALARPNPGMVSRVSSARMFGSQQMRDWAAGESNLLRQLVCSPVDNGGGGGPVERAAVLTRGKTT